MFEFGMKIKTAVLRVLVLASVAVIFVVYSGPTLNAATITQNTTIDSTKSKRGQRVNGDKE